MSARDTKLTERDIQLFRTLSDYRYLAVSQIQRKYFPSPQTAYRRLKILGDEGFISGFSIPNINETIYHVTRKGMQQFSENTSSTSPKVIRPPSDYYFMRHLLAINDFRIALEESCVKSGIQLKWFIADYHGTRALSGEPVKSLRASVQDKLSRNELISHTPDGAFLLEKQGKHALFFLEIDRSTEVISDLRKGVLKTILYYVNCLIQGQSTLSSYYSEMKSSRAFRVLFVTTSATRIDNMRMAVSESIPPTKATRFVWLTTFDKVSEQGTFGHIWMSADKDDSQVYYID